VLTRAKSKLVDRKDRLLSKKKGGSQIDFKLPTNLSGHVLNQIKRFFKEWDKLQRCFLWVGDQELSTGKYKVPWTTMCQLLEMGGLGILDLECYARAQCLWWLWFEWVALDRPWIGMPLPLEH